MHTRFNRETAVKWIAEAPGITDRELAERVFGPGAPDTQVASVCHDLEMMGLVRRRVRTDGALGNWLAKDGPPRG
jgi:hypothetical protein